MADNRRFKKNVGKGERLYGYQNRKNRKGDPKCISGTTRGKSETITAVLTNISRQQEAPFKDPDVFTRNLYIALVSNHSLINILFSGTEKSHLGDCLEAELKRLIKENFPEYQNDPEKDIMLSFCIQGCFHAYLNNQDKELDMLIRVSEVIVQKLAPLYIKE